jgi:phospholipase C
MSIVRENPSASPGLGAPGRARLSRHRRQLRLLRSVVLAGLVAGATGTVSVYSGRAPRAAASGSPIKHVVVVMLENHSFDNYFGTFPGANGIPSTACVPNPATGQCLAPYHNPLPDGYPHDMPHTNAAVVADIDKGKMDGFLKQQQNACKCAATSSLGYYNASDIPIFWRYAEDYTLQDNLFEQITSWSFPSHVFLLSEWAASCTSPTNPMSCTGTPKMGFPGWKTWPAPNTLPWTDMTYLLYTHGVSWGYYNADGTQPVCASTGCTMAKATSQGTHIWWNPLPWFLDVQQDKQLANISVQGAFYSALASDTPPAVSWVIPNNFQSGHPGVSTNPGSEEFAVDVINAIESSPEWDSTAIFLAWDDGGGEYDQVVPPTVDALGYGMRVPGILISAYGKHGYIDHQTLSFDAYNKFIEDTFLNSQRLDPANDGRPDSRPSVRENNPLLGDLNQEFNFSGPPSPPILFPTVSMPATVGPATTVTVNGAHFLPGDTVEVQFNCGEPDCLSGTDVASATAAADGTFTSAIAVPTGLAAGTYFVSAQGSNPLEYFGVTHTSLTTRGGAVVPLPPDNQGPED